MDEVGVTQHGIDKKGNAYLPPNVINSHISWMGQDFLRYVNDKEKETCWEVNLGASYGTEY
jgi:hypothetical protein